MGARGRCAEAAQIVRDLAAVDEEDIFHEGRGCSCCGERHADACPWLRAQQWVETNPG